MRQSSWARWSRKTERCGPGSSATVGRVSSSISWSTRSASRGSASANRHLAFERLGAGLTGRRDPGSAEAEPEPGVDKLGLGAGDVDAVAHVPLIDPPRGCLSVEIPHQLGVTLDGMAGEVHDEPRQPDVRELAGRSEDVAA